jgi:hypothetical protein
MNPRLRQMLALGTELAVAPMVFIGGAGLLTRGTPYRPAAILGALVLTLVWYVVRLRKLMK